MEHTEYELMKLVVDQEEEWIHFRIEIRMEFTLPL